MTRDYLLTIIEVVGVVQCLFIATALWYLPGNHPRANRWLGLLFLVFAIQFAHLVIQQNDLLYLLPLLAILRVPLNLLYGPLLYLYLWQLACPWQEPTRGQLWRHFGLFIGAMLLCAPALLLDHNELLHLLYYAELSRVYENIPDLTPTQQWITLVVTRLVMPIFVLQLFVYLALDLRLLFQHKRRVQQHFSRLDKVSLDWMRNLLLALTAICVVVAVRQLLLANTGLGRFINDLLQPALVLFVSALGIFGLLQKGIPLPSPADQTPTPDTADNKYQSSTLTEQAQTESLRRLKNYMESNRPYLDSELTLTALATAVGIPARHLSQIINSALGQNFIDFINHYRVEEAKRLLTDPSFNGSILDIAMDAGFNSKSAFYAAFKRHTGQTPSGYRDSRSDVISSSPT